MSSGWQRGGRVLGLSLALLGGCGEEDGSGGVPTPEVPRPSVVVEFLAPREMTATRSELSIALSVQGAEPDRLDLYVDENWVARLDSATYRWDTRDWPEGEHTLTARVRMGEQVFTSPGRKVVVDRSPPRAVARQPLAAETVSPSDPFLVSFSEPLRPSALESLWLEARLSTGPAFTIKPLALSEDRKTLVFRHEMALSPPVTLFVTPRGELEDDLGNRGPVAADLWYWNVTDDSRLEDVMRGLAFADYPLKGLSAPVLRLDARGRPVVAWRSAERKVIVRRWEDSAWVTLMSAALSESDGDFAGLQLDGEGRPLVAMRFPTSIELWRWDGTRWSGNGGVSTAPAYELTRSAHAALACRSSGLCRVVWLAESRTTPGSVRMSLHAWSALNKVDFYGGAYDGQASLAHPLVLATNESGASLVSWAERRSESTFVTQFKLISRTGEEKSLPSPTADVLETRPVLALSPADEPTVSWAVRGSLQVRQWKAGAWSSLGERLPTPPEAEPTAFAQALETTAAGQALVAWSLPGRVELWRWNGSTWARSVEVARGPSGDTLPWPTLLQGVDEETAYLGWVAYDPSARGRVKLRRVTR